MSLYGIARTSAYTSYRNVIIGTLAFIQFGYFIGVPSDVHTQIPSKIFIIDNFCLNIEFDTLVAQTSHIGVYLVRKVGPCRNRNTTNQIVRLAIIVIQRSRNAIIQKSEIDTGIPRRSLLPFNIGVIAVRTYRIIILVAERIGCRRITDRKQRHIREITVANVLLSRNTIAQPQLQFAHKRSRPFHKRLVDNFPPQRNGRECAPTVIFRKARCRIAT